MEKDLDEADQPVMETVCRQLGVNLVTGTGFMTISAVYAMLDRHPNLEKPIRIIYLSDFDASGEHMPIGPARHIENAIEDMDPKPDIRLYRLALTAEQVQEKSLPKKIGGAKKDKEKKVSGRKIRFEARHGVGSVELNAVTDEANVPWFEDLLRGAILALRDGGMDRKLRAAKREADALVGSGVARGLYWPHRALNLIKDKAEEVVEGVIAPQAEEREALKKREEELRYLLSLLEQRQYELDEEVDEKMAPLEDRAEPVQLAARVRIDRLKDEIELPTVAPEEPAGAAENWLFDSRRGYFTQRSYYLGYKGDDGSGRSPEELDRLVAARKQEIEEGE